jgi:hypothetical protein
MLERLAQDRSKVFRQREELRQELEELLLEECTFQPNSDIRVVQDADPATTSLKLYKEAQLWEKRRAAMEKVHAELELEEVTGRPAIHSTSQQPPLQERIHDLIKRREELIRARKAD